MTDNYVKFKKPKVHIFNELGKEVKKCPKCNSKRLKQAIGKGFFCQKCKFLHKRRFTTNPKEVGKVTFRTYGTN